MRLYDLSRRVSRLERADRHKKAQAQFAAEWRADAEARSERIRQQVRDLFPHWDASRQQDEASEKGNPHRDE